MADDRSTRVHICCQSPSRAGAATPLCSAASVGRRPGLQAVKEDHVETRPSQGPQRNGAPAPAGLTCSLLPLPLASPPPLAHSSHPLTSTSWNLLPDKLLTFPDGSGSKESICNAGATRDVSSIPGSGRSPRRGHGNPLQCPCLENPMDRGAWRAAVHRVVHRVRHG